MQRGIRQVVHLQTRPDIECVVCGSQGIAEVAEDEVVRSRTAYWALVHRMDRLIGEMLDAMHDNGLADDTLVVYTSDHVCS